MSTLRSALLLFVPILASAGPFMPSPSGYYSEAQFDAAVLGAAPSGVLLSSVGDGTMPPGLAVSSDIDFDGQQAGAGNGRFASGVYSETTSKYSVTTWTFTQPVYAFGGEWNLGLVNAGLEIDADDEHYFMPDGFVRPLYSYAWNAQPAWPASAWSGFWGFVSTVPIEQVEIRSGDEGTSSSFAQSYRLSSVEIATAVPEPGSLGPICAAAAFASFAQFLRSRPSR
ncbi:MAG: hypothetical protein M3Y72_15155 [Acidobacteriota bacterium]|nr:hypothetical protein [Acidobacteriota bacterium]